MKRFLIYWLPVLLWAGVIFYASSQPYKEQDLRPALSRYLDTEAIGDVFSGVSFQYAEEEVSVKALGAAGFVEFFIRKAAHFTVYFVLAFLLYRALSRSSRSRGRAFWPAFILAGLYAASDEFHQSFTGGRTPLPLDVGLDSFSALIGTVVAFLVYRGQKRISRHRMFP
ncbi:MAG TPA: VanZ family protein [Bacillales bacterium]|nr:VanZ family protein [Bacillales bacterium]